VNVPVGIAAFALSLKYVPESRADAEHRIFHVPGAVTVTAGLVTLVYGIVKVQESGWTSASTIGFGLLALVTGFHWAFFGSALFFVAGILLMLTLLKPRDVEVVDVDRPLTEMAA
jgi:hypothetical protein